MLSCVRFLVRKVHQNLSNTVYLVNINVVQESPLKANNLSSQGSSSRDINHYYYRYICAFTCASLYVFIYSCIIICVYLQMCIIICVYLQKNISLSFVSVLVIFPSLYYFIVYFDIFFTL